MFSIDRLRASRFFWHRHKGVGKTERCSCRVIFFSVIEYAERHIGIYRRLVLDQYDDLSVDEAGDVIAESHIHHLFETERLELDKCVELCPVERVVEGKEVRLCVFVFAEEIE